MSLESQSRHLTELMRDVCFVVAVCTTQIHSINDYDASQRRLGACNDCTSASQALLTCTQINGAVNHNALSRSQSCTLRHKACALLPGQFMALWLSTTFAVAVFPVARTVCVMQRNCCPCALCQVARSASMWYVQATQQLHAHMFVDS